MTQPGGTEARVAGLEPWLPWPLSGWKWWTQPVRAERLAVLRISLACCLLVDVLTSYHVYLDTFFAPGGLGSPEFFAYYGNAPRFHWSILRGFGDPLLSMLALTIWLILSGWLTVDLWGRWTATTDEPPAPGLGWLLAWLAAGAVFVLGVWARSIKDQEVRLPWTVPLGMSALALAFFFLDHGDTVRRQRGDRRRWLLLAGWALLSALAICGWFLPVDEWAEARQDLELGQRLLRSWQEDATLLTAALWTWVAAIVCLLAGFCTRAAAIATWVLSMSFANVNPYIDNAGDSIRGIILFYLMLCPCGAAWSLDSWLRRRRGRRTPSLTPSCQEGVYVWPWPLRLLFLQMVAIYFLNGLYKLTGADWLEGQSLRYVLCDLTLTRISFAQLPLPLWLTSMLTWSVLAWEVSFPLLVALRWTRSWALLFGVAFHLGIFATMELGGFVPYMLCLYTPLLPWDRWLQRGPRSPREASVRAG